MKTKIITVYDVRQAKHAADAEREYRSTVRHLRAKVKHWEQRYAEFGGDVHLVTLNKFRDQLSALTGGAA